jgi:hypothetical protein
MAVSEIERRILDDTDYENWCCDTIRRRLIGLNRLPNLDSLFENDDDDGELSSTESDDINELANFLAMASLEEDQLAEYSELFFPDGQSSSSSEPLDEEISEALNDADMERIMAMDYSDTEHKDLSWLDYVRLPFNPSINHDSAVTNKYFDDFIQEYFSSFGRRFYKFFVRKPNTMSQLVVVKRKRELEDGDVFGLSEVDMIV